ncbi:MAG: flagellin [Geothrix sp.]|nr:flagellin [Geothrix sp.]
MSSILNNVAALGASRQLGVTNLGLNKTIERLTTGKRINRASDDAAGLAISNKLGADIRIAGQGRRNANDGISILQTADGVLDEVTSLLTRAAELAQQAQGTTSGEDSGTGKLALDAEYQKIITTITDLNTNTKFNGTAVFGSTVSAAVGDFSTVNVALGAITNATGTITTTSNAATAASSITAAITAISTQRGDIGAGQQQLQSVSNSLGIQVENFTAAYSQIRDANIADEVVNLSKFQILNQSGISALGQANQSSQSILALLR